MELLRFTDGEGREWEVWEVGARPVPADRPPPEAGADHGAERWLCFESGTERRRLRSYPGRWHAMSPPELSALCRAASPGRALPPYVRHELSRDLSRNSSTEPPPEPRPPDPRR